MRLLGIDLSLNSPALCFHAGDQFSWQNCQMYFLTDKDKYLYRHPQLHGEMFPEWGSDSERYNNIATWVVDVCKAVGVEKAYIEGYSFQSVGRVFAIAENGGILKYLLWKNMIEYSIVPPTVIKKFATGKGNATKEKLQEAFIAETGADLKNDLTMTAKQWNPSSDLIDSYYICKYGFYNGEHNACNSTT